MAEKKIFVFDSFSNINPILLGYMYIDIVRGNELVSFEFDENYLDTMMPKVKLDPDLSYCSGRQYAYGKKIFGLFADSSPNIWGRALLKKKERILADKVGKKPSKLFESDFLLGVYDETRMGGLRFKTHLDGPFVSSDIDNTIPPWTSLRKLEASVKAFESDDIENDDSWFDQLIKPGSSLGGARPKANVSDTSNNLWIAKFPSRNDSYDVGAWEMVVHDLAKMCMLNVVEAKLERFSKFGSTYLVRRFDRDKNKRIHFASAMTLLGKTDGQSSSDGISYLDIADFIKENGINPKRDLRELWRRIVFNMAVSNTDDHLRNHGFIYNRQGWSLSPLYDVNPIPYGDELSLNVDEYNPNISFELAVEVSNKFSVTKSEATEYCDEVSNIINSNYKNIAKSYGLSNREIDDMSPAFYLCSKKN